MRPGTLEIERGGEEQMADGGDLAGSRARELEVNNKDDASRFFLSSTRSLRLPGHY